MRSYGLIGYPLGHSFSRRFFTEKFATEKKEEQYLNFEIDRIELIHDIIVQNSDLAGLNVTIPYKEKVLGYMDSLDQTTSAVGAVNTIRIERKGNTYMLKGFNTDVYGFTESLRPLLKPGNTHALVLGTGGASKAVCHSLSLLNIACLLVSRNKTPGISISYHDLSQETMDKYTIVINTTPLGTYPNIESFPPIPYQFISPRHLLYDLVYNPGETLFLRKGREHGGTIKNGYEMLELQALKSYEIWNNQA